MKNEENKAKILPTIVDRIFALEKNAYFDRIKNPWCITK